MNIRIKGSVWDMMLVALGALTLTPWIWLAMPFAVFDLPIHKWRWASWTYRNGKWERDQ